MALPERIEAAIRNTRDFDSFVHGLLSETLGWPIGQGAENLGDIGYAWFADELRALDLDRHVLDGQIWQIQPLPMGQQPWGVFLLEFKKPDVFTKGRGFTGLLRKVIRGLVPNRRKSSALPSWNAENILFICTHNWEHYRFAHFRSADGAKLARLSTFGWGPETSNRTACEFNLPELKWPDDPSDNDEWVKRWVKAFDKEELTKQFYKTFADLYYQVTEEIAKNRAFKANAQEQAQLLLDRLLFLSFLQKKRWLDNDPGYLYNRFSEAYAKDPMGDSFYSTVLYPLFEALSNKKGGIKSIGVIPFLNGGLFNLEWGADQKASLTQVRLIIRNSTFKKIFDDLLNKYNFTVMEDTPLNREVAVDPEMLGKVFETVVLVSDTGGDLQAPDLRKATGSYYTPRIVVHFICREVLLKYLSNRLKGVGWEGRINTLLEIDASEGLDKEELSRLREIMKPQDAAELRKAVERLKCCDPAVGSGAFAVGLLQELLNLTLLCEACEKGEDPRRQKGANYLYDKKLQIIENSVYGVDIQAKAVDICKLRLWLSLVVDYELGVDPSECTAERFEEAIASIPPLPNLAYKIRQGDALLDQIHGVPFRLDRVKPDGEMTKVIQELRAEHQRFFKEVDAVAKRHIRKTVLGLRLKLSRMQLETELKTNLPVAQGGLFGETAKDAKARQWREEEEGKIRKALAEVDRLESQLLPFKSKSRLSQEDEERLNRIEYGTEQALTFSWRLDFPEVFNRIEKAPTTMGGRLALSGGSGQQEFIEDTVVDDGFDIIVGNPPFVTARNEEKRELYRQRWQPYCYRKYHLLVPFFPRAFGIMAKDAQLGLIVSNAFAKREFGKPLVEGFFPTVDISKVVDCSGLMFPGHGTPTCLVFGRNCKPSPSTFVKLAAILPGGGDLRTAPEDSPLWDTIEQHHNDLTYCDSRIVINDVPRKSVEIHPWNFDSQSEITQRQIEGSCNAKLKRFVESIGQAFFTNADEVFLMNGSFPRRAGFRVKLLKECLLGDEIRDWQTEPDGYVLKPYNEEWSPLTLKDMPSEAKYLSLFRKPLGARATFQGPTYDEAGKLWYGYHIINSSKLLVPRLTTFAFMSTHNHFVVNERITLYKQTAPIITWDGKAISQPHLFSSILNSSSALFWLKQVCFNKGAGDAEEKDRFEYAGGKVEQLPIPDSIAKAIDGHLSHLSDRLTQLSTACWERGQALPSLAMKKLFEKKGEAYDAWNRSLPGYTAPHALIAEPFTDTTSLQGTYSKAVSERDRLRTEMIALQEELDWLVYEAYGLIDAKAKCGMKSDNLPEYLLLDQRPFELWATAGEDFDAACKLIPKEWDVARRDLWERRLTTIRDNEHVRRIEQPVYKRRWYQPDSYDKQFRKAFDWWLLEKAEWWLEHKKGGGPATLDEWSVGLWQDMRVQAAATVVEGTHVTLTSFSRLLRSVVNTETVPEGMPFAIPWEEITAKGVVVPAKAKNIRGKLNVPRERFRLRGKDEYIWAGLEWIGKVEPVKEAPIADLEAMLYPSGIDKTICAMALAIVEQATGGIGSMAHLDALLMATHPSWCKSFLEQKDHAAFDKAMSSFSRAFANLQSIRWSQCRDYLEQRQAVSVNRRVKGQTLAPGTAVVSVKGTLPQGADEVVKYALKALKQVESLRKGLLTVPQEQQDILDAFTRQHQLYALAS